jgi:hypothetical protein
MHATNIELQGIGLPSSICFETVSGRRYTYPIWNCVSREAEDIILGALEQSNPRDPHEEIWPLMMRGEYA